MKNGIITARAAARLSRDAKAKRLVILAVDDDGNWAYATAGKPGADQVAIADWAHDEAEKIVANMAGIPIQAAT